jgi:hypothetical protein
MNTPPTIMPWKRPFSQTWSGKAATRKRLPPLFEKALELELQALAKLEETEGLWWSVLHRSAGWLALDCNQPRLAEKLACTALAGEPPTAIANQLWELLEVANFNRHLELQGVTLGEGEVQISLVGRAVARGMASLSDIIPRVDTVHTSLLRIVQRRHGLNFRGQISKQLRSSYPAFASTPRVGSFAMSILLGHPTEQLAFPEMVDTADVVNEFMDLMDLANKAELEEITRRIPDGTYRANFLGLAKRIAPDGERIRQVGFMTGGTIEPRTLSVTTEARNIPSPETQNTQQARQSVEVSGMLRFADAGASNRNLIKLVNDDGPSYDIRVPVGLLDDIVRPLWNLHVTVRGSKGRRQQYIALQEIWESIPTSGQRVGPAITASSIHSHGFQQSLLHP